MLNLIKDFFKGTVLIVFISFLELKNFKQRKKGGCSFIIYLNIFVPSMYTQISPMIKEPYIKHTDLHVQLCGSHRTPLDHPMQHSQQTVFTETSFIWLDCY